MGLCVVHPRVPVPIISPYLHFLKLMFQFMGLWYILEYQYPTEMAVADLSCLSFRLVFSSSHLIKLDIDNSSP